ncbi:MAG TPA: hypothetical protein VMU50_09270 [Polyangia bacterium]|nr:hypothetical protein [Polyangia bacterium]
MTRALTRLTRLAAGLATLALIWGCNAPFIPVPPPAQVGFASAPVSDGMGGQKTVWTASGNAGSPAALAQVFVINQATSNGVVTRADPTGAYKSPAFDGTQGDHIDIYFEDNEGARSATACLILQDGAQAPQCGTQ